MKEYIEQMGILKLFILFTAISLLFFCGVGIVFGGNLRSASDNGINLTIWDSVDDQSIIANQTVFFYANYTINTTHIDNAVCYIYFLGGGSAFMERRFDSQSGHFYSRTFPENGSYIYNISCNIIAQTEISLQNGTDNDTGAKKESPSDILKKQDFWNSKGLMYIIIYIVVITSVFIPLFIKVRHHAKTYKHHETQEDGTQKTRDMQTSTTQTQQEHTQKPKDLQTSTTETRQDTFASLHEYIKKSKAAGYRDEQIKENLLKAGWQETTVDDVIKRY